MTSLKEFRDTVASTPATGTYRPLWIELRDGELDALEHVCRERLVTVRDTIDRQIDDLVRVRFPSPADEQRRRAERDRLVRAGASFGRWAYFPWLRTLVHVLDREDYYDVVTNRNRDKVTADEQRTLRSKRIGVVGLSVGGEAAVTLAQEHLCGSIVLADFDALDLSNLNRLNAGVDELSENKACLVARRIARINPYLDVHVFTEGVTSVNADAFLDGLDLLVEECDHLPMKYSIREMAMARGLNVVYAADERGFLSVEPYAQDNDLELFHGRVAGPQPTKDDFETPVEFMKALTEWLGGWEQISERSRTSVEKMGISTVGYPQLASEARYAAGQVGHVARRLLLGEVVSPFAGYLDLGELV